MGRVSDIDGKSIYGASVIQKELIMMSLNGLQISKQTEEVMKLMIANPGRDDSVDGRISH